MFRCDDPNAAAVRPVPAAAGAPGYFQEGNPATNTAATGIRADFLNMVQEEMAGLVTGAGVVLAKPTLTQVLQAVKRLSASNYTLVNTAGATALTADMQGLVYVDATAGNVTLNLPAANAAGNSHSLFEIFRADTTTNTVTIARAGTDVFQPGAQTSLSLGAGQTVSFLSDGNGAWYPRLQGRGMQTFTASGTLIVPPGVTRMRARVQGGGGGASWANGTYPGSGGGAGGYAEALLAVTPGASFPITVGGGGAAGTSGSTTGVTGGTSSFGGLVTAYGGVGGFWSGAGTASGGDGGLTAFSGATVLTSLAVQGGIGGDGCAGGVTLSGYGGASAFGGGGRASALAGATQTAGRAPGSGGGGTYTSGAGAGGAGAAGLVIVEWN